MDDELITVTVDRPIGSSHPDYPSLVYPVNYGYIEGVLTPGGEEQDAYIIGVDIPVDKFTGRKIAIIHRKDDVGDKWVVAPENMPYTKQQIEDKAYRDFTDALKDVPGVVVTGGGSSSDISIRGMALFKCSMKKCGMPAMHGKTN